MTGLPCGTVRKVPLTSQVLLGKTARAMSCGNMLMRSELGGSSRASTIQYGTPPKASAIDHIKAQLTELLTQYGPIPLLVFDGWSWKMGHKSMPYAEIRDHVKSLQPACLVVDHTHLQNLWDNDLVMFEEPKGVFAPNGNTLPA